MLLKRRMGIARIFAEGLAGVALSVIFTLGVFPFLPFIGLIALALLGATALVGLLFLWALFLLPSLVIGIIFLRRKARVFGWSMIATGVVVSLRIQLCVFTGSLF